MALIRTGTLASWLNEGEVRRHCIHCEAEVERLERFCPICGLQLRKECPACHYWNEVDRGYCLGCRHSFPLPPPPKATVKIWHLRDLAEEDEPSYLGEGIVGHPNAERNVQDSGP